ncbi:DUF3068 domain-containing protein [Rhodococcus chondri]|uniref:DUF3068 domain-containing protein n=1 Tax=Rhodococcus chondri TaxID=3065941 RepID=A0ABU7JZB3_9NOCA|nr:DUF3068 domain-containing protein [Rhodococcus sp. CC-R104]MEE2035244.1 DUF3068 domain-containing protein [Rhodococcus sp. CC-R104]
MAERSSSGRILALILVGLGAFLLVIAILVPTYTIGKMKTTPLDLEVTTIAEGTGDLLNSRALLAGNAQVDRDVPIVAQRYVTTEDPANSEIMTLQSGQTVRRLDMQGDSGLVTALIDRVTIDRVTAMPVSEEEYPERVSTVQTSADAPPTDLGDRDGLQYKFPFDVKQESYPYYDINARQTFPLNFEGEEELNGLKVYHFRQEVGPIDLSKTDPKATTYKLSLPASTWGVGEGDEPITMTRWYNNIRDLWVDPVTGVVVKGQEQQDQYYARSADRPEVTVLNVTLPFDDQTVENQIARAKDGKDQLALLGRTLPIILGILGVIALIAGFLLGARSGGKGGNRAATSRGPAPAGPATTTVGPAHAAPAQRDYTDDRTEVIPRSDVDQNQQQRDWTTDQTQEIPRTDLRKPNQE